MISILLNNPLLLLFIVVAVGYPIGRMKVFGCSLGLAAVLFSGLAFGSLHPEMKLPGIIYIFGLVLFVYSIGLSSGTSFFTALRKDGMRDNLFALIILALAFGLTLIMAWSVATEPLTTAGMFAGSLTNTPALAAILETVKTYAPENLMETLATEPVVAYSIAYPMGVMGIMLAIVLAHKMFHIEYKNEAKKLKGFGSDEEIQTRSILITKEEIGKSSISQLIKNNGWNILFGRLKRAGHSTILTGNTTLEVGDIVTAIGTEEELNKITPFFGMVSQEHIERDKNELQIRRIFVSNPEISGMRLKDLKITARFGATVTRLRRGDMDILVNGKTLLEPGDRVRVIAPYDVMEKVSRFLGDSYRAVSELDILTFSLGLVLGLLIGLIPIPVSGDITLKLGVAGGPLVSGLILGYFSRSGNMVWNVPYSVNMTLRQLGLVLFLAGVGTKAGYSFSHTLFQGDGYLIFIAGSVITFISAFVALVIGHKVFGINFCILTGMVAGLHTQPAVLGFALEQAKNDLPNVGYSTVYPTATIVKILLAQIIITPYLLSLS
ncbi:MAG: transporter [Nitrospinae bacterium]|nr:transporter [Nitrospinota bacterium]